jgi:hypothetical protein
MSEAEVHLLRTRMYEGLLHKARRGEVFNHPPIGYIKGPGGGFELDPDEQVQGVVRLIFEQFERQGTVCGLLRYLVQHQVLVPVRPHRRAQRGQLQWRRPNRVTLQCLLHHPIYAGFYRFGHRAVDLRKKVAGRPQSGRTLRAAKDCRRRACEPLPRCPEELQPRTGHRQPPSAPHQSCPGRPQSGPWLLSLQTRR